jgi:hypothetical protein
MRFPNPASSVVSGVLSVDGVKGTRGWVLIVYPVVIGRDDVSIVHRVVFVFKPGMGVVWWY